MLNIKLRETMKNKTNKITYRLRDQLKHLRDVFSGSVQMKNKAISGNDGRFDLIYKLFLNESSYVGFRVKKDDILANHEDQKIDFYVVRILEHRHGRYSVNKQIFSPSKEISTVRFFNIIKEFHSCFLRKESFVGLLKKEDIFDFDINLSLLSAEDFAELIQPNEEFNEQLALIKTVEEKANKNIEKAELNIEKEKLALSDDIEYQELLRQKAMIEEKIKQKEACSKENQKILSDNSRALEVIDYLKKDLDRIDNRRGEAIFAKKLHKAYSFNTASSRLNQLNIIDSELEDFEKSLILNDRLGFKMLEK